jgi:hypothetical protein
MTTIRRTVKVSTAASLALLASACGSSTSSTSSASSSTSPTASSSSGSASSSAGYTAGSYSATGEYQSPAGTETIKVDVTIESDGTITSVEVTPEGTSTSLQYQTKFASGISSVAVGKSIADLTVDKVSGSSLTGAGFNKALATIASEAKA